jgi:hypothetical protein
MPQQLGQRLREYFVVNGTTFGRYHILAAECRRAGVESVSVNHVLEIQRLAFRYVDGWNVWELETLGL